MIDILLYFFAASGVIAWLIIGAMYWYYRECFAKAYLKPKK